MSDKYRKRNAWTLTHVLIVVTVVSMALNALYFVRLASCQASLSSQGSDSQVHAPGHPSNAPDPGSRKTALRKQPLTRPHAEPDKNIPVARDNPWASEGGAVASNVPAVVRSAPKPVVKHAQQTGGLDKTTLLIICYNRPDYLKRTLKGVAAAFPAAGGPHVVVSQDGDIPSVTSVAAQAADWIRNAPQRERRPASFEHIHHSQQLKPGDDRTGYGALARHFGYALTHAFERPGTDTVIILEDDLDVAVDFFEYFGAMAQLLRQDKGLLAASAYNDMGQAANVGDPGRALRSDFFPGLGWMLHKRVWSELKPIWPSAYWDDWLREPAQRKGRHIIHPEVSRTRTFGEKGVSQAQFFHKYLGNIHLNSVFVPWRTLDLSYLSADQWDADLQHVLASARSVGSAQEFRSASCPDLYRGALSTAPTSATEHNWLPASTMQSPDGIHEQAIVLKYRSNREYESIARQLGIITDIKANVPRTAYHGVVPLRHGGCLKLLVRAGQS